MDLGLKGKVVVVTGGSAGIGFATAKAFLAEGARLAICARHQDGVEEAVRSLGSDVFGLAVDMTQEAQVYEFARAVAAHFGKIDVWVNNVGASIPRKGQWYSGQEIDRSYEVCFKSVVMGSQAAIPYLKETKGVIVNVASLAARCATSGRASLYGPLKSAVVNYTNTFAGEVAAYGVRVVCVMPGFTLTPLVAAGIAPADLERNVHETLLRRAAMPEEIAAPIVFLASGKASYMTSTTVEVSGGRSTVLNPGFSYEKQ
ncbi:MAG: SDR family oxidoreductase [Treponema sp.]|nr:SDR family oxidoreductase [Treponema sp.]